MDTSMKTLRDIFDDIDWNDEDARSIAIMRIASNPERYRREVLKRYEKKKQVNSKICKDCGICCKQAPCHYSPKDFKGKLTYRSLKKEIDKGYISIIPIPKEYLDTPTKKKQIFVLRVRGIHRPISDIPMSVPCKMLTKKGCAFSYSERPKGGRMFIPREIDGEKACFPVYDISLCAADWIPYTHILKRLYNHYQKPK